MGTAVLEAVKETAVLDAVQAETSKLVTESQSPKEDISFEPRAVTKEGRTD
jgi:hypothetical protein